MSISIIVPLFYGKNFIEHIINQVDLCAKEVEDYQVELILYNDCPNEKIEPIDYKYISNIKCINAECNLGIHGARVKGLQNASGQYVVFLDQDDYIYPLYLKKQLSKIGDADFCVCKLFNGNMEHYTDSFIFEEVVSKEFMINNWCSIVSPGQVLIKKESIPDDWIKNTVRTNGSDDYYLWLLLFGTGKKIAYNNEILFKHHLSGFNTSNDTNLIMDSEEEIINKLLKTDYFNENEKVSLSKLKTSLRKIHIKKLDNISVAYFIQNFFDNLEYKVVINVLNGSLAIYGASDIGIAIYNKLKQYKEINLCFIDRNADNINFEVPVYKPENAPEMIDGIIIAINGNDVVEQVRNLLLKRYKCPIYSLKELVQVLN